MLYWCAAGRCGVQRLTKVCEHGGTLLKMTAVRSHRGVLLVLLSWQESVGAIDKACVGGYVPCNVVICFAHEGLTG